MKGSKSLPNLVSFFEHDQIWYMKVCRVKPKGKYSNIVTGFILEGVTEGLFVVVLEDNGGGNTHTIGINRELNVICDCTETHELKLSTLTLTTQELKDNRLHAKKPYRLNNN